MELEEFVKDVVLQLNNVVVESNKELSKQQKSVMIYSQRGQNDIMFDIAVSASDNVSGNAGAGIKVLSVVDLGGKVEAETKNSKVSRIQFGISFRDTSADNIHTSSGNVSSMLY